MEIGSRQVCEDVMLLMERMKCATHAIAEAHKLTTPQVFALHCILRGQQTMGAVAHKLHCDASNVTGIIDRLVSQGLVVRAESEQDRRAKTLELTQQGGKVVEELWQGLAKDLGCERLSTKEQQVFHELVGKLTQTV